MKGEFVALFVCNCGNEKVCLKLFGLSRCNFFKMKFSFIEQRGKIKCGLVPNGWPTASLEVTLLTIE